MARTKKTYKMVSDWTYIVSGDHGHYEQECETKRDAQSWVEYQTKNLRGYGTDIKIEVVVVKS